MEKNHSPLKTSKLARKRPLISVSLRNFRGRKKNPPQRLKAQGLKAGKAQVLKESPSISQHVPPPVVVVVVIAKFGSRRGSSDARAVSVPLFHCNLLLLAFAPIL